MERDLVTEKIIGSAIEVHRHLGPGLLESAYQRCLTYELSLRKIAFACQVQVPARYKGIELECGFRMDFFVEGQVIVELKAVAETLGIHRAQLLSYMKLADISTGLLLNFHVELLRDGITRMKL